MQSISISFSIGLFLGLAFQPSVSAQDLSPSDFYRDRAAALTAIDEQKYADAAQRLRELLEQSSADGELWLALGRAAEGEGRYAQAIKYFARACDLGYGVGPRLAYGIASLHARLDQGDEAMRWLETAIESGFEGRAGIQRDETFAAYSDNADFRRLAGMLPERPLSREEGWAYDLGFLAEEIERLHGNPDRPAFAPVFRASVEMLRERIPDLTNSQIFVEMQRIVASLGDGHSVLFPIPNEQISLSYLPLELYEFGEHVFVVGERDEPGGLVGAEILKFADMPTSDVLDAIEPFVTRDNPMSLRWTRPFYLTLPAFLQAAGVGAEDDGLTISVRDNSGDERVVSLSGAGFRPPSPLRAQTDDPPLYLQRPDLNFRYLELSEIDAIYFQYNQVRDGPEHSIAAFADTLASALRDSQSSNLIVDVRLNNGGNLSLNRPLVNALVHFENNAADNRIYVLVGRNTFSAAQNFVNVIDRMTDAVFVGEPTGSSPNMVGENTFVLLPFSGIMGSIASRYHQDSHAQDDRVWIAPSVPVELTAADYFSGRDPVMEAVYALILSRK